MLARPIVDLLADAVRRRYDGDLDRSWIVPRPERGGAALAIQIRASFVRRGGVVDGSARSVEVVAVCAVAGDDDDAFDRLDRLQHAVSGLADDEERHYLQEGFRESGLVLASLAVVGMEWGEAEQGSVRLCEVRLLADVIETAALRHEQAMA